MLSKTELQTLSQIVSSLNFYQILKVSLSASEDEVREAFHHEALNLHPDRYLPLGDAEASRLSKIIYSKLVDAYRTLSNRKKREEYDQYLQVNNALKGATARSSVSRESVEKIKSNPITPQVESEDENEITAIRKKPAGPATSAGVKFFKLAQTALQSRDFSAAKMNIQIALNTDPKNPEFLDFAERLQIETTRKKS